MDRHVFWRSVSKRFQEFEAVIRDVRFPEKADIEAYQLSHLLKRGVPERYNFFFYPQSEKEMLNIVPHLVTLSLPVPDRYKSHFLFRDDHERDTRGVISLALANQDMSPEFVDAWGQYNFAAAALIGFMARDGVDSHEKSNVRKNMPYLVERCIFAFWMEEHWLNGEMSKEEACESLGVRILDILDRKANMPEWKSMALRNMLVDPEGDTSIKKTYSELSRAEILSKVKMAGDLRQGIEIK